MQAHPGDGVYCEVKVSKLLPVCLLQWAVGFEDGGVEKLTAGAVTRDFGRQQQATHTPTVTVAGKLTPVLHKPQH
ncbi:hypothetical protein GCM10009621_08220 [Corynebacterium felinum]